MYRRNIIENYYFFFFNSDSCRIINFISIGLHSSMTKRWIYLHYWHGVYKKLLKLNLYLTSFTLCVHLIGWWEVGRYSITQVCSVCLLCPVPLASLPSGILHNQIQERGTNVTLMIMRMTRLRAFGGNQAEHYFAMCLTEDMNVILCAHILHLYKT